MKDTMNEQIFYQNAILLISFFIIILILFFSYIDQNFGPSSLEQQHGQQHERQAQQAIHGAHITAQHPQIAQQVATAVASSGLRFVGWAVLTVSSLFSKNLVSCSAVS